MYLMNFSNTSWDLSKFDCQWNRVEEFLKEHRLEGVEIMLHQKSDLETIPKSICQGLHLRYYPTWLEFYNQDDKRLSHIFGDSERIKAYYGGLTPDVMINAYKQEFELAKALGVKYMVFHVAHVTPEHTFNFEFDYTDNEIIDATIKLVNQIFETDSEVELLFENLWWPGLNLKSKHQISRLMTGVKYKNKGIMLDLSHLLITNPDLRSLKQGTEYILKQIHGLGDLKSHIHGIHMNMSLSGEYYSENHDEKLKQLRTITGDVEQYIYTVNHIKRMDWHEPYDDPSIQKIVEAIRPRYVVFEVTSDTKEELNQKIATQNQALNR